MRVINRRDFLGEVSPCPVPVGTVGDYEAACGYNCIGNLAAMSDSPSGAKRIRFGNYEADLAAGELRKNGRPLRVQEQPFQVLTALIERPGEVVTREQLRERLWADQTFVDFDQGLNTAINKLREVLGDSVANPRFIETLPKRGYRFLCPIDGQPDPSVPASRQVEPASGQQRPRRPQVLVAAVAALAIAAAGSAWLTMRPPDTPVELPLRRFSIQPQTPIGKNSFFFTLAAVSPDARQIAFVVDQRAGKLWVQDLDQSEPRELAGTEGAVGPFWSPDSKFIGFVASGGVLKKVPVAGGPPTQLCDLPDKAFFGGTWSSDGASIVVSSGPHPRVLYEVPAAGGTPQLLLSAEPLLQQLPATIGDRRDVTSRCLYFPHFLPVEGSRLLAFTLGPVESRVILYDLQAQRAAVFGAGDMPVYSAGGHLVYRSGKDSSDLWAQPFSLKTLEATGAPFPIARNGADPSVAADGTLVYLDSYSDQLVWLNRQGRRISELGEPAREIYYPAVSSTERFVAAEIMENLNLDIWVYEAARGSRTRLSAHPDVEILPVWSPAEDTVAFSSYRAGNTDIFLRSADAGAEETALVNESPPERVSDWSHNGEYILYSLQTSDNGHDLWYMKRTDDGVWEPHSFLATSFHERVAKLAPDGRYVAYISDESGRDEVYVRSFPVGERKWTISTSGASQLRWRRDGREIFYVEGGSLVAVPVRTEPEFAAGTPVRLFAHSAFATWTDPNYDVSADGQRVLVPESLGAWGGARRIQVVQNWLAEFRVHEQN
jgi:Tol biopolymer transport system component/DNA-binding winged helix-turn-helix (wHTH) protein